MPFYDRASCAAPHPLLALCQHFYVICYSTVRKTPLFTGERLIGTLINRRVRKVFIKIVLFQHNFTQYRHQQGSDVSDVIQD